MRAITVVQVAPFGVKRKLALERASKGQELAVVLGIALRSLRQVHELAHLVSSSVQSIQWNEWQDSSLTSIAKVIYICPFHIDSLARAVAAWRPRLTPLTHTGAPTDGTRWHVKHALAQRVPAAWSGRPKWSYKSKGEEMARVPPRSTLVYVDACQTIFTASRKLPNNILVLTNIQKYMMVPRTCTSHGNYTVTHETSSIGSPPTRCPCRHQGVSAAPPTTGSQRRTALARG
jgi:hypothetical protein